jgi:hypothetical protein
LTSRIDVNLLEGPKIREETLIRNRQHQIRRRGDIRGHQKAFAGAEDYPRQLQSAELGCEGGGE